MVEKEKKTKPRFGTVHFDRRKHPRFSIHLPVEYWQIDNSESVSGQALDISEGGLLLYLPQEIEVGQNIRLKLFIGSGPELKSIEALARVVWKDIHWGKEEDHRIGVKFVDISAKDMDKLKDYLNTLLNLKSPSESNIPEKSQPVLGISIMKREEVEPWILMLH